MLEIDGSIGYGQVLRTAIGLASLTKTNVKIFNIRVNRPNPGLQPQHLAGIKIAAKLCNAKVENLRIGSKAISFYPRELEFEPKMKIDIGTSGSISLLLQTILPIISFSDKKIEIEIKGGTSGLGAPTIEYFKFVTLEFLKVLGIDADIEILKQGFYPKGGGKVRFYLNESSKKLKNIKILEKGELKNIKIISVCGSLPKNVAKRQAKACLEVIREYEDICNVEIKQEKTLSKGTSITIVGNFENSLIGEDKIGEIKKRAEDVGSECGKGFLENLKRDCSVDKYMGDQLIPFLFLAKGESKIKVFELTQHCLTNIKVCEKFFGELAKIEDRIIKIDGIGFTLS